MDVLSLIEAAEDGADGEQLVELLRQSTNLLKNTELSEEQRDDVLAAVEAALDSLLRVSQDPEQAECLASSGGVEAVAVLLCEGLRVSFLC